MHTLNGALSTQNGVMKRSPSIHVNEFSCHTISRKEIDGYLTTERFHPEFGSWNERSLDLGHIRVHEHQANLHKKVNVHFDDGDVMHYVHHCMSLEGKMGARFVEYNIDACLHPNSFHNVFLPGDEYFLTMEEKFVNVHIEIARDYFAGLLSDSEKWSAELKEKLLNNKTHYTGEFQLSRPMIQIIHTIFNSSLSGSLKELLIEAKVHELIALQLHQAMGKAKIVLPPVTTELFQAIRQYLNETFLEQHTLKNIARHFGINEFALKKGFRENFNTSVFDYLQTRRMEYGRDLIQNTHQTIQQVSASVGYHYPNHFSAAFKKKFGVSPGRLRN